MTNKKMSAGHKYLHSHSALERELKFDKNVVLIDTEYKDLFGDALVSPYKYKNREYLQVNILTFVRKGGVFKNLMV